MSGLEQVLAGVVIAMLAYKYGCAITMRRFARSMNGMASGMFAWWRDRQRRGAQPEPEPQEQPQIEIVVEEQTPPTTGPSPYL